jgi:hypothetical protein
MINRIVAGIRGNLVAWLALFVALGGTSLAASHYVINSTKQINPKVIKKLKGNHGARGARGLAGPAGPAGAVGAQGPAGTPSTANFFNKTESDGRYLGAGATAADSAKLGGTPAADYTFGPGAQGGRWLALADKVNEPSFLAIPDIGELGLECETSPKAIAVTLTAGTENVFVTSERLPEKQPSTVESVLLAQGKFIAPTFGPTENGSGAMIIQASTPTSSPSHQFASITLTAAVIGSECRVQANYTLATQTF